MRRSSPAGTRRRRCHERGRSQTRAGLRGYPGASGAGARDAGTRIADKWTLLVIEALEREEDTRFTRLQERIGAA